MGLFSRKKDKQTAEVTAPRDVLATSLEDQAETPTGAVAPADMGTALRSLVQKMRATADGQVTLDLTQSGNDMNYKFYQRGNELEGGSVLPGGDWFSEIADLYVEEEKGERGAFNRALIVVNPAVGGEQSVQASFMNSEKNSSHNLSYTLAAEEAAADATDSTQTESPAASEPAAEQTPESPMDRVAARLATQADADTAETATEVTEAAETEEAAVEAAESQEATGGVSALAVGTAPAFTQLDSREAAQSEQGEESTDDYVAQRFAYPPAEQGEGETSAEETEDQGTEGDFEALATATPVVDPVAEPVTETETELDEEAAAPEEAEAPAEPAGEPETSQAPETVNGGKAISGPSDLPVHLDDEDFTPEPEEEAPAAAVAAAPADSAAPSALEAPTAGENVDVAPSFAAQSYTKPSESTLAEGNLVLSEAEVISRFSPVYDALFGKEGTALDVSTVLIRVRTLGSYYDALTHVRRGGFWEQVRTFDLVPEETLAILQLKADSYKEGQGSPLAINIRLTPGVPAAVAFDYADEEAFVSYPERLPAQQYVEELRMFPRTGANIPEHMNEALASWTF